MQDCRSQIAQVPGLEEMEQAINKFLQRLEKQKKKGFKDLATLLSHLPNLKTAQLEGLARSMSVAEAWPTASVGLAHRFSLLGSLRLFKFQCQACDKSLAEKRKFFFNVVSVTE